MPLESSPGIASNGSIRSAPNLSRIVSSAALDRSIDTIASFAQRVVHADSRLPRRMREQLVQLVGPGPLDRDELPRELEGLVHDREGLLRLGPAAILAERLDAQEMVDWRER
jgi:hypothetical protein